MIFAYVVMLEHIHLVTDSKLSTKENPPIRQWYY